MTAQTQPGHYLGLRANFVSQLFSQSRQKSRFTERPLDVKEYV
jgi:hypothetical protein